MKEKLLALWARLENSRFAPLLQFVKFGLVGVSNTLISLVMDLLSYYVLFRDVAMFDGAVALLGRMGVTVVGDDVRMWVATLLAFLAGTINSFILNNRFVFRAQEKQRPGQLAWAFIKTLLCYALTGIVLAPLMKGWLVGIGTPYWLASPITLIVTIPLNFIMNKFWAFAGRK